MVNAQTFRLDGRVALVSGSSAGIGLAIARGLAEAGASVVLNGRDAARLEAAAGTLRAEGHAVHTARFDTSDAASVQGEVARIDHGLELVRGTSSSNQTAPRRDVDVCVHPRGTRSGDGVHRRQGSAAEEVHMRKRTDRVLLGAP